MIDDGALHSEKKFMMVEWIWVEINGGGSSISTAKNLEKYIGSILRLRVSLAKKWTYLMCIPLSINVMNLDKLAEWITYQFKHLLMDVYTINILCPVVIFALHT